MASRVLFAHNHIRRQLRAPRLIVKSLNRFDHGSTITAPLVSPSLADVQRIPNQGDEYTTISRSAYSVLRSRNGAPNTCAQKMILPVASSASENMNRCCCTALLYRADKRVTPQLTVDEERERDDFVLALKLSGVEAQLRDLIGEERYAMLVGHALTKAQQVGLCQDLSQLVACTNEVTDDNTDGVGFWMARLLLTLEEDNRIRWLREDEGHSSTVFSRLPSFKAMYALYHAGLRTSFAQQPSVRDLEAIEERMQDNRENWSMSDVAVLAIFALRDDALGPFFCHVVCHILLKECVNTSEDLSSSSSLATRDAQLRHVLAALLLQQGARRLCGEAQKSGGRVGDPPTYLLSAVSQLFRVASSLRGDQTAQIVLSLARSCSETVFALSAQCTVPAESPLLPDFTLWLLREASGSDSCRLHFSRMVQRSHSEALALLERSGLLITRAIDLDVVVSLVLPLLDSSGNEEFFFVAIREVMVGLEERLRGGAQSFTAEDMRHIATLGTRLCETPTHGRAHDIAFCGQLEELSVMDGSPWALVTFSYRSLKEILRALVRDHRRLKRQMETQVRHIVDAVTAHTTEPAPVSGGTVDTAMQRSDREKLNETPSSNFSANLSSSSSPSHSSKAAGADDGRRMRLSTPPMLRERFIVFVEKLVKNFVRETKGTSTETVVVNDALYAFVNQYVTIPNIHDEFRQKLFFLVNVSDGKSGSGGLGGDGDVNGENSLKDDIPPELRFLVASLPLTLSPWASVMILREVLSESAGNNPRYTYVLNAAIDLQLPISTTRSRIATTLNMWRFLTSQSEKLNFSEQVAMKRRCALNLPFAYILSSYWSLLTWVFLVAIVGLNVVGLDFESQYVATRLFDQFAAPEDVLPEVKDSCAAAEAEELVSLYLADAPVGDAALPRWISSEVLLSSASSLFLGEEDRRYPMTVVRIKSDGKVDSGDHSARAAEHACAAAVLRALSLRVSFPFYISLEQQLPLDLIIARVAERIRRVSFNHAWIVSRVIFRTFPLGRHQTEYGLVSHTCAQANLTRRRVTFLLHVHHNVSLPPALLVRLRESILAHGANLVVIASEESLVRGGTVPQNVHGVRWLSHEKECDGEEENAPRQIDPRARTRKEQLWSRAAEKCAGACTKAVHGAQQWIAAVGVAQFNFSERDGAMRKAADPFRRAPLTFIGLTAEWASKISQVIE